jgi:hypothetical protein
MPATALRHGERKDGAARIEARWGDAVLPGFQPVPDVLIRHMGALDISSTELAVILNITLHWWGTGSMPFPRPSAIARRMNVTARTVERAIAELEKKELLKRLRPEPRVGQTSIRRFDLSGLKKRLEILGRSDMAGRQQGDNSEQKEGGLSPAL